MAKKDKKSEKVLEHGSVVLNSINQKVNVHNTIYTWRVPNYADLELGVMYFQAFDSTDVKCVFKLFKTKANLYLCLRSFQFANKRAQFYVVNETNYYPASAKAIEISDGLYTGEFTREELDKGNYVLNGMLTVSFRYVSDQKTESKVCEFDGVDILADLDELCCDLKHMYLDSLYPDFEIVAGDYVFKAHKFILAARCEFFQKGFDDSIEDKIELDAIPGILHEVLLYVYCGELMEMDFACMLEVFSLASYLEIKSLVDKCVEFFKTGVNESNFHEFCKFRESYQSKKSDHSALDEVFDDLKKTYGR